MSDHTLKTSDSAEKNKSLAFATREIECMSQITQGKTIIQTAEHLKLSKNTVYFYLTNVRNRLNTIIHEEIKA